jgi:predicted permease
MWTWLNWMIARIRALFRIGADDRDFGLELESHLSMLTEDKMRAGITAEEARRQARLELGGVAQLQEAHREARLLPFVDTLLQDLRYTFRTLRRDAGFAIFAILIIGIGIGASSTILNVVNAVLLRPLPFDAADRLVWITNSGDDNMEEYSIQVGHFPDLRKQTESFSDLAAYSSFWPGGDQILTNNGESERLVTIHISQNFLSFLGVHPIIGRQFNTEECQWNGPKAVLLSYQLWQSRYASDPAIIGRAIILNDMPVMVAGVLPASFNFATVFDPGGRVDIYAPFPMSQETNRWGNTLKVLGRLKPGVSIEKARAEFEVLGKQLTEQHLSDRNPFHPKLTPLAERVNGRFRPALIILAWAVGAVMLIVCANLSNLQLTRMAARKKEMAIRIALGAGRRRLIRQLLTESIVLSFCGAGIGLVFSVVATRLLAGLDAFNIPLLESVRVDVVGLGFTMLIAVVTGISVGLAPALQASGLSVYDDLKDSGRGNSGGQKLGRIRGALVVSEVAFAFVLLVGAGLLIQSFFRVLDVDLGFQPDRVASLRIDPSTRFPDQVKRHAYYDAALRQVNSAPGVEVAALADVLPLGGDRGWQVGAKGQVYERGHHPESFVRVISDRYFQVMGVPLRAGRDFTEEDTALSEPVVVINEALAHTLWPDQDPIGQFMTQDGGRRVIGVVGNVRHRSLEEGFTNEMYLPIRQTNDFSTVDVVVRSSLPPGETAASVRAALKLVTSNLPKNEWRPLRQLIDKTVSPRRFVAFLIGGFSVFALILASLGIYGVVSYSVNQRTQEIGIRMALGASAKDLQAQILFETLRLASVGVVIGFVASWWLGQALTSLLFGMTPTDPVTLTGVAILLSTVAAAAGYLPARRASRIDPVIALRAN